MEALRRVGKKLRTFIITEGSKDPFQIIDYFFYAKIGFLLALLVILDVYATSFVSTTGLGRNPTTTATRFTSPSGLQLEEGQKYLYDFKGTDRVGFLEIDVLRSLGDEFLMRGELAGNFIHPDGSLNKEFGSFEVGEYFLVSKYNGASPGVNFFSGLWNNCGVGLLNLEGTETASGSRCLQLPGSHALDNAVLETMPGLAYAEASPRAGAFPDLIITARSFMAGNKIVGQNSGGGYIVFFNIALAGFLFLKLIASFGSGKKSLQARVY